MLTRWISMLVASVGVAMSMPSGASGACKGFEVKRSADGLACHVQRSGQQLESLSKAYEYFAPTPTCYEDERTACQAAIESPKSAAGVACAEFSQPTLDLCRPLLGDRMKVTPVIRAFAGWKHNDLALTKSIDGKVMPYFFHSEEDSCKKSRVDLGSLYALASSRDKNAICTMTAIGPRTLLTAAHCFDNPETDAQVRMANGKIAGITCYRHESYPGKKHCTSEPDRVSRDCRFDLAVCTLDAGEPDLQSPDQLDTGTASIRSTVMGVGLGLNDRETSFSPTCVRFDASDFFSVRKLLPAQGQSPQASAGDGDSGGPVFEGTGTTRRVRGTLMYSQQEVPGLPTATIATRLCDKSTLAWFQAKGITVSPNSCPP